MRVVVLQFAVGEYTKMLDVSRQRHLDGCRRFGYSYRCDFALRARHPYWHKLQMVIEAIRDGFDYIAWIDADAIWSGMESLTDAMQSDGIGMVWSDGLYRPPYYTHYNCGVYFVRCVDDKQAMLDKMIRWSNESDNGHPWGDQHAFHELLKQGQIEVTKIPKRFNCEEGLPTIRVWHGQGMAALQDMINFSKGLGTMNSHPIAFRKGSWDESIWNSVREANEYGIKGRFEACVVDIGAHIGAFVSLAESIGAKHIIAVEPDVLNLELLQYNSRHLLNDGRLVVHSKAIAECSNLKFSKVYDTWPNTGGASYAPSIDGTVDGITIDELIQDIDMPILLKMDCEGAEFGSLKASRLKNVQAIVGEYHGDPEQLKQDLIAKGFEFSSHATSAGLGLFGAHRTLQKE